MIPAAAIVLAAGRGRRMGGPKALLPLDGDPLVALHARRLAALGCARVLVVAPRAIEAQVRGLVGDAIVLGRDTPSQAASLAAALAQLSDLAPTDRLLVTPVDLRPPRLDTLRALCDADGEVVVPRCAGRRGHPVIVRARVLAPYADRDPPPLRQVLAGNARVELDVEDTAVLGDFDEPGDLVPAVDSAGPGSHHPALRR